MTLCAHTSPPRPGWRTAVAAVTAAQHDNLLGDVSKLSAQSQARLREELAKLPDGPAQTLADYGVKIVGVDKAGEHGRIDYGALYHPEKREVWLSADRDWWTDQSHVLLHELGHALDYAKGIISNSGAFRSLYRDAQPTGKYYKGAEPRRVGGAHKGQAEMFAESFAATHGGYQPTGFTLTPHLQEIAHGIHAAPYDPWNGVRRGGAKTATADFPWGREYQDGGHIARGLVISEYPESFAKKVAAGTVTGNDFMGYLGHPGVWWYALGRDKTEMGLDDAAAFAEANGGDENSLKGMIDDDRVGQHYIAGEISVVLVAKRPSINGHPWNPQHDNPADGLMGNSFLHDGMAIQMVEVLYDAGWGWKRLPCTRQFTARRTAAAGQQMTTDDGTTVTEICLNGVPTFQVKDRYGYIVGYYPTVELLAAAIDLATLKVAYNTYDTPTVFTEPIYRGMAIEVTSEQYAEVLDRSTPLGQRAKKVLDLLDQRGIGWHWAGEKTGARHFAYVSGSNLARGSGNVLSVLLTARPPRPEDIQADPDALHGGGVQGWAAEREVPLKPGAQVVVYGVDWWDARKSTTEQNFITGGGIAVTAMPGAVRQWRPVGMPHGPLGAPRPVTIARPAQGDLNDLDPHLRAIADDLIERLRTGKANLEAKHRPPLDGTYTMDIFDDGKDTGYRIGCYVAVDNTWVVYWIGQHQYQVAENRMRVARKTSVRAWRCVGCETLHPDRAAYESHDCR